MNLAELRVAIRNWTELDSIDNVSVQLVQFAQQSIEDQIHIPQMEATAVGTLAIDNNIITVPSDYLELIYIRLVDRTGSGSYQVLNRFSELDMATYSRYQRLSLTWTATTVMSLGWYIIPTTGSATFAYEVTTAGTTGASEPTWPVVLGGTVVNGTVTFTAVAKLSSSLPTGFMRMGTQFVTNYPAAAAYLYNVQYYKRITQLAADSDTNWWSTNTPELLMYGAILKAGGYLGADARIVEWRAAYDSLLKEAKSAFGRERFAGDKRRFSTALDVFK